MTSGYARPRIALLDDEARMVDVVAMVLRREGYEVEPFVDSRAALEVLGRETFDLLITDLRMPGPDGLDVLRSARSRDPRLPVILITAHGSVPSAIAAMKEGAFDYIQKPFDNDELKALVRRALELTRLSRENRALRAELQGRFALDSIVAESASMRKVLDLMKRAADSPATVLVTGESGTGKELVARAVHVHSQRLAGPFVAVNCKSLASGVLESELFGHERGAFTGAERSRAGLFEQAQGGTLFLDEIGEVDADFQAKLLRTLQERNVRRVGGNEARPVDVRVVAASNRDLRAETEAGRFREDLYFRLAVVPIQIPPLRERPEDVVPLARHFLARWAHELGRPVHGWSQAVEERLRVHAWPGNARELENAIQRGVVLAQGDHIEVDDLLLDLPTSDAGRPHGAGGLREFLDRAAAERIHAALQASGGRRAEAADQLGIDRTTLYRLMRKLGVES